MREAAITSIEQAQQGLIATSQLRALGVSKHAQYRRLQRPRHAGLRRGVVISSSIVPGFEQRVLAAVLAGGTSACASHESAGELWQLPFPGGARIEILTPLDRRPKLAGVRMHRSGLIDPTDVTRLNGIPLTTPTRTIVDLSGRFDLRIIGAMTDDALRRKLLTLDELWEVVERLPSAPGRSRKKMRSILLQRDDELRRRESVLEDFVHGALERFGLPVPVVQHRIVVAGRNRRIDLCYPESMLALEPIGFDRRRFRQRFDEDALRGNELQLAGYRVLYFTSAFTDWKVATQVAEALALPTPARPRRPLTFLEWLARRDRLGTSSPRPATKYPNGSGTLG